MEIVIDDEELKSLLVDQKNNSKKVRMAFGERRGYRSTIRTFILLLYITIKSKGKFPTKPYML
jgi:hypothetical protein